MVRGQRNHAKEQHWRRQVAGWRRSGDSVRAYCQAHGLSEQSFYQWRRVLAQRDAHAVAGAPDAGAERGFRWCTTHPWTHPRDGRHGGD